jgi:VWFA-related protein
MITDQHSFHARLAALFCALLIAAPVGTVSTASAQAQSQAQTAPPPPAQQAPAQRPAAPPLRVSTRLVQVSVIVEDKKGEPVTGLTKDDFTLLDGGQPQSIAFFAEETNQAPPAAPVTPAVTTAPAAHVFSNRFEEKTGVPTSVTVILLDALNTHFTDMAYARAQVKKFLKQLHPGDHVALYGLSNELYVLHDFTQDADSLLHALDNSKNTENFHVGASEETPADTGDDNVDAFMDQAAHRIAEYANIDRVNLTAEALEAIADHLAGMPGRKNLVWVSGAFPINMTGDTSLQWITFSEEIESAARALNNGNIAVYPVDARGLIANADPNQQPGALAPTARRMATRPPTTRMSPPHENFDTMNMLADRTGGRASYNNNDINGAVRRAIDDSRVTYVLSYYPTHGQWDGKFREIKVEVKRQGTQIRYRRGYFALPDETPDPNRQKQQLVDAVASPLESTALGIQVQAQPADTPSTRQLKAHILVDYRQMLFAQQNGRWVDHLEFVWVQLAADGHSLETKDQTLDFNLLPALYETVQKNGLGMTTKVDVRNDTTELRLVARDAGTGAIGSVNIPLRTLYAQNKPAPASPQK